MVEADRSGCSEGHYQTSQTDISGIVVVIDLSPEASVKPSLAVETCLRLAGGRPRSSCHLVCIQSEGAGVHNDHERRVAMAEQIYTDSYRQRMPSTSIIICRWDDAGKDRDRGG